MTEQIEQELIKADGDGDIPSDVFEEVEIGEWTDEHKHQHKTDIYRHKPTGRLFALHNSRSGSYWSDYEYDEPTCNEVFAVQVTVTKYFDSPCKAVAAA